MAVPLAEKAILLWEGDDVAVAKERLAAGTVLMHGEQAITVGTAIPPGHKVALAPVRIGQPVRKYGQVIGDATEAIRPGDWVHTHNLHVGRLDQQYEYGTAVRPLEPAAETRTFQGYRRSDRRVGTR